MKKFISAVMALAIILTSTVLFSVAADTPVVTAAADNTALLHGDSITVTYSLSGAPEIKSAAFEFFYDKDVFEPVSGQWLLTGATLSDYDMDHAAAVIAFSNTVDGNKDLFTLKLAVKDSATATAAQISAVLTLNSQDMKCDAAVTDVAIFHPAASVTVDPASPVCGETVDFTLSLANAPEVRSLALEVIYDDSVFETVSGTWLIDATLKDFNKDNNTAVIAFTEGTNCNKELFTLQLKVKENAPGGSHSVSFSVLRAEEVLLAAASAQITLPEAQKQSFTLSTFGDSTEKVDIEVYSGDTPVTSYSLTPDESGKAEIPFSELPAGQYKFVVSKKDHVSREVTVDTASPESIADVKLHLKGDINGDGRVNTTDVGRANAHAKKTSLLTDYAFACADINGDGRVNTTDVGRANAHAKKTNLIW